VHNSPGAPAPKRAIVTTFVLAIVAGVLVYLLKSYWPASPQPPGRMLLADETEIFYAANTRVSPAPTYPTPREIEIDGEALVRITASGTPLIVKTRLLLLTSLAPAEYRVKAHWTEAGEQVEVLSGTVEARKAYPSTHAEPDILAAGEISMINKNIDLMEKETTDIVLLRAWRDQFVSSISKSVSSTEPGAR
jgi:hypothetical protein